MSTSLTVHSADLLVCLFNTNNDNDNDDEPLSSGECKCLLKSNTPMVNKVTIHDSLNVHSNISPFTHDQAQYFFFLSLLYTHTHTHTHPPFPSFSHTRLKHICSKLIHRGKGKEEKKTKKTRITMRWMKNI